MAGDQRGDSRVGKQPVITLEQDVSRIALQESVTTEKNVTPGDARSRDSCLRFLFFPLQDDSSTTEAEASDAHKGASDNGLQKKIWSSSRYSPTMKGITLARLPLPILPAGTAESVVDRLEKVSRVVKRAGCCSG